MDCEKRINEAKDNKDKQQTYRTLLGRYKKALDNGFYFEALLIEYAMIEDRLRSFLFYIGAFREREAKNINVKKTKAKLRVLYYGTEELANGKKMNIDQISVKEDLIRKSIIWAINHEGTPDDDYLAVLKETYIGYLDLDGILSTLDEIDEWRRYRNEIIHGLLNKNIDAIKTDIKYEIEIGMKAARFLDGQIKNLKKKNNIRVKMKIYE